MENEKSEHHLWILQIRIRLQLFAKTLEKLCKFWKSCNRNQNINGIYNKKLHNNCLQLLPALRLKTEDLRKLGNLDEKKWKAQTTA